MGDIPLSSYFETKAPPDDNLEPCERTRIAVVGDSLVWSSDYDGALERLLQQR